MENFNKANIKKFVNAAYDEAVENGYPPIVISVGSHKIAIPMIPESFESMELFLAECLEIWENEYK